MIQTPVSQVPFFKKLNVNDLEGLAAADEDNIIEISTEGVLKLQPMEQCFQISGVTYKQTFEI